MSLIDKNQTGFAGEYFVAAELTRRNFAVSITMGNTKAIDILAEKDEKLFKFQVKSIQRSKSISFNLKRDTIRKECFYVFVNINADTLSSPEYFVLTSEEVLLHLKLANSGRDWIDINYLRRLESTGWEKIK